MRWMYLYLAILGLLQVGCSSSGLKRSSLDSWKTVDESYMGFKVTIPNDYYLFNKSVYDRCRGQAKFAWVNATYHPLFSGHILTEPFCLMSIDVIRLSDEDYRRFLSGERGIAPGVPLMDRSTREFCDEIREFGLEKKRPCEQYFRKDLKLSTGDIVLAVVRYNAIDFNAPHLDEDIAAIKRMLNSVEEQKRAP